RAGALGGLVSGSGPTVALLASDAAAAGNIAATLAADGLTALTAHGPARGAHVTHVD
ncbi:MAG: 4-(cytidine 5'-diphospho)-2-C-methyl-D-erythritol kinase, partial [Microbacterium sp.]